MSANHEGFNILIVGLGLIGGSAAKSVRGFKDCRVYGCDTDARVIESASAQGVLDGGSGDAGDFINIADVVVLCLYPRANMDFLERYAGGLKPGAVVCDMSGIKGYIAGRASEILQGKARFVPAHPMAGKEKGGYEHSDGKLFRGANFIITPTRDSDAEAVELIKQMALHMGFGSIVTDTPQGHDAMIAYTSQLMHVVAVALCNSPRLPRASGFSAGSLRDCTRVAVINETLWSELFIANKEALVECIEEFEGILDTIKKAVAEEDYSALNEIMRRSTRNKLEFLNG